MTPCGCEDVCRFGSGPDPVVRAMASGMPGTPDGSRDRGHASGSHRPNGTLTAVRLRFSAITMPSSALAAADGSLWVADDRNGMVLRLTRTS